MPRESRGFVFIRRFVSIRILVSSTSEASNEVPTRTNGVMIGELSRGSARWKYNTGEDAGYLQLDEKTPGALLQLDIEDTFRMRSIVVRLWSSAFGRNGVISEIAILRDVSSNLDGKNGEKQYLVGSLSGALSFTAQTIADCTRNYADRKRRMCAVKPGRPPKFNPLQNKQIRGFQYSNVLRRQLANMLKNPSIQRYLRAYNTSV